MASVKVVFRKDKLNKNGKAPIHFRIIKHRRIRYISANIMLAEKYWSARKNAVKPSYPNSNRINSLLANKVAELQDGVFKFATQKRNLNTAALKEELMGKKPVDFFEFAEEILAGYERAGQIGSHDKNKSTLTKLKNYQNGKRLDFQDMTVQFLVKYEKYLREKKKNKTATVNNSLKFFRKVYNEAVRQKLVDRDINPFEGHKMKSEKSVRTYLTEDEIISIENVKLRRGSRIELHRDMFVFASYAAGLRVSDVLMLKWDSFDGEYLHITIRKTGKQIVIKCPTKVLEIIQRYKDLGKNPVFIFPQISEGTDLTDLKLVDRRITSATAYINSSLKDIAKLAKITKNVSFHVSRHTWATRALTRGMSIDKVSKLMGHATIKETQVYAKIVGKSLDDAMGLFG